MKHLITFFVCSLAISGCAVKPTAVTETIRTIDIKLSKRNNQTYRLIDQNRRVIATSHGGNGLLSFPVPRTRHRYNRCLTVIDQRGKVFGNLSNIKPTVATQYYEAQFRFNQSVRRVQSLQREQQRRKQYRKMAVRQLGLNQAFIKGRCVLPAQRYLSPRPNTKCKSERECKEEGGAICYNMVFTANACSIAASKLKVSGILTSPSCGLIAAKLAKEKYGMGDLVADAIIGGIEDSAKNKWNKGEYGNAFILGFFALSGKYLQAEACTTKFINKYYGPLRDWRKRKTFLERERYNTKQSCETLSRNINRYIQDEPQIKKQLEVARNYKVINEKTVVKLQVLSRTVEFCK